MTYVGPPLHHLLTSPGLLTALFTPGPLPTSSMTDICHLLNSLAKDIGKLNCFKKVSGDPKVTVSIVTYLYLISIQAISGTKSIAKYFSKSSFACAHHLKL